VFRYRAAVNPDDPNEAKGLGRTAYDVFFKGDISTHTRLLSEETNLMCSSSHQGSLPHPKIRSGLSVAHVA
jgi:hypothetical protein